MRLFMVVSCIVGLACGSSSVDDSNGGSTDGTGPSASDSDDSNGGSADGSAGDACDAFADVREVGPAVEITVRNEGSDPVYYRPADCGDGIGIEVTLADGRSFRQPFEPGCHPTTCGAFMNVGGCDTGCDACAPSSHAAVSPGAEVKRTWTGEALTELAFSPSCAPDEGCPDTCKRREQTPEGVHTVAVTLYRSCTVGACICGDAADCLGEPVSMGDPFELTVMVDYPAETSVEVVVED